MGKKTIFLIILVVLQMLAVPAVGGAILSYRWENVMVPGVCLGGVSLGGLDRPQSGMLLGKSIHPPEKLELILEAGAGELSIPGEEIKLGYKIDALINEAYAIGHSGSTFRRFTEILGAGITGYDVPLRLSFDREALAKKIEDINREYKTLPQNAALLWQEGKLIKTPPVYGREIDIGATLEILESHPYIPGKAVPVVVKNTKPPVTERELSTIEELLGSFATSFNPGQKGRAHNIKLAGEAVNGVIINPGEEFSFTQTLGVTDKERGYQKAPVIMGNQLTEDYGGGVCQVSTTLYNAVLLAGVEVLERHSHVRPVDYVEPGLDATVALGELDFKFKNNKQHPLYISCGVDVEKGNVEIRILGKDKKKQRVKINPEVVLTPPSVVVRSNPALGRGEISVVSEGGHGYRVNVYRVTEDLNGETRELISTNYYPAEPRVVEIGPPGGPGK